MLLRQLRQAKKLFGKELEEIKRKGANNSFAIALDRAIKKGYKTMNPRNQTDLLSGQNVHQKVTQVYNNLEEWKRPYMAHAMGCMADYENSPSAVVAKLAEIVDRGLHCTRIS